MRFKGNVGKNVQFQKGRNYKKFNYSNNCYRSFSNGLLFFSKKNLLFEMYFFVFFKKITKYFFKKNNALNNVFFLWTILKLNYPISKKSKNSRMGKGKGQFLRWVLKVAANSLLIKIKSNNLIRLNSILSIFKKSHFQKINIKKIM